MKKSSNDIDAQLERVLALARSIGGRYTANAKNQVDVQYFAQIARRAKVQHGIGIFDKDKNERKPLIYQESPKQIKEEVKKIVAEQVTATKNPTPTEQAHNRVVYDDWMQADAKNRYKIQTKCRHAFINKLYSEMLMDMEICKMESWDVLEFPRMLRDAINVCFPKPKQLTLF